MFVPLNDSLRSEFASRMDHIINDCHPQAAIVVAHNDAADRVKQMNNRGIFRIVLLEEDGTPVLEESMAEDLPASLPPIPHWDDPLYPPLYVLYTSGSTGKPKGVIGTHKGLINRLVWQIDTLPWQEDECACRRTPITFVDALAEIFSALLCGVPMWVPPLRQIEEQGIHSIVEAAAEAGVTRITMIPSQLEQMLRLCTDLPAWTALKYVVISGERASMDLVHAFHVVCPEVTLVNLYGSTEVAGDVTYAILNDHLHHDLVNAPIGMPIQNNSIYLLQIPDDVNEDQLRLIHDQGVPGQLAVSGSHVCWGYLNEKKGNSSKFRPNPFSSDEEVLFLTGDIAVYGEDSGYTWVGRMDNQVKVHGVRIGLEEIESTASHVLDRYRVVIVTVPSTDTVGVVLIMVVEVDPIAALSSEDYLKSLRSVLPPVAMPSAVITMKCFPLTSSGKVDRKSIYAMIEKLLISTKTDDSSPSSSAMITRSDILSRVKSLMQSVLLSTLIDGSSIKAHSSFFGLGGDSMRAIELLWKLKNEFDIKVTMEDLKLPVLELSKEIAARQNVKLKSPKNELSDKGDIGDTLSIINRKRKLSESRNLQTNRRSSHYAVSKTCSIGKGESGCGCRPNEDTLPEGNNMTMSMLWRARLKKCIDASVLFVSRSTGDRQEEAVVVGSHAGDLACFIASTGELKWTCNLEEHIEGSAVIDHYDRLYIGTYAANDIDRDMPSADSQVDKGCLYAIDLEIGELSWTRRLKGEIKGTPLIISSNVWIGAYDGYLYCIDGESGEVDHSIYCEDAIYASPSYSREHQTIYCATIRGQVYAIHVPTLSISWRLAIDSPIYSSILCDSQQIIFGAIDSSLYAVDACNGYTRWTHKATKPIFSSPVKMRSNNLEGFVVGSHDGYLRFLSIDGDLIWTTHLKSVIFATPFVFYDQYIIVSTTAGNIYLIDGKDGSKIASVSLPAEIFSTPIVVNRTLYCGCRDDFVYAFRIHTS